MPWIAPLVGGIGSIASGAIGAGSQADARNQSKEAYEASVRDLEAIGIPTAEAQQITLEQYKSEGKWTPELEQAVGLGDTAMNDVSTDPQYKAAQLDALGSLKGISDAGGMTLSDRANLERTEGSINAKQRGAREAILQNEQQRSGGVSGSGSALAAQLMSQQQGAQEAHDTGLATEAAARDRALQAIQSRGALGSSLRTQDFGEQSAQAAARDAIAKWNAANSQDVAQRNTAAKNTAAQYNLAAGQNLSNANVDTRNKQEVYNKSLPQQQFQDELAVAQAKAGARAGQAQNATTSANQVAGMWGGVGSGVAQAGTAIGQQQNSNDQAQKDRDLYAQRYGLA